MLRNCQLCCYLLVLLFAMAPVNSHANQALPNKISLDGQWDFCYRQSILLEDKEPSYPDIADFQGTMTVPGYWDDHFEGLKRTKFWSSAKFNSNYRPIDFPMGNYSCPDASSHFLVGVGYYRRNFNIVSDLRDKNVTLHIGGIKMQAWIWLNGKFVGHHKGYSTPFEFSVSEFVKPGDNELIIAVDNVQSISQWGCGVRGWKGTTGGIYRSTYLEITGNPRVSNIYLYPTESNKKINWNIELEGNADKENLNLHWKIRDKKNGDILGSGKEKVNTELVKWSTGNFSMQPWSEHAPTLYDIEIAVQNGDVVIDQKTQPFGMREIRREGINLLLNGRPVILRGTCEIEYYPETCTPPIDVDSYRNNIRHYKAIGFNWLRFHTTTPHEEFMQAADELGIMIQVEAPYGYTNGFTDEDWIETVRLCRKHPSIILYCVGNEWYLDDKNMDLIYRWGKLQKVHAPDAMFNPMEAMGGVEYNFKADENPDDMKDEPFRHNAKKLERLKEVSDAFGQYTWGYLSYSSTLTGPKELEMLRDRLSVYERPCLSHENGILGGYLNLDLEKRYEGTRIGTGLYASVRQNLKEAGLLQNAKVYYENSCALFNSIRKHNMESARKLEAIKGYDYLGGIDPHWHRTGYPCGFLNEFYELKPGDSVEDILKYNGESVLLLGHSNQRNLTVGDNFSMEIMSSLYGFEKLDAGLLTWYAKDDQGKTHHRGNISLEETKNGKIEKLGKIEFTAPDVKSAVKLTVYAHLSGGEYEIDNDWDFWVFPKPQLDAIKAHADAKILSRFSKLCPAITPISKSDDDQLRAVSSIDLDTLQFIDNGGSVILFGAEQFPLRRTAFKPYSAGRPSHDRATVITDHPLMQQMPHDGYADWQFHSMLEGGKCVVFNDIDLPFDPIFEIVSSYKNIMKQASIFELSVGKGKLLVCILNISETDPAGLYLLEKIFKYASSDQFQPKNAVGIATLAKILDQDIEGIIEIQKTDEAYDVRVKGKKQK